MGYVSLTLALVPLTVITTFLLNHAISSVKTTFNGPAPYPLIGNILPLQKLWLTLDRLAKTYGPMFSVSVFGRELVIVNSVEAATELVEGKGDTYWLRPSLKMVNLSGMENGVVFQQNHQRLKTARKLLNTILNPRTLETYEENIHEQVSHFLERLRSDPEDFVSHIGSVIAGITLNMSHGYTIHGKEDPLISMANETVENFSTASKPGGYLVDVAPFLAHLPEWLPGMGFKKQARAWKGQYREMALHGHKFVKAAMSEGTAKPSLTSKALSDANAVVNEEYEDIVMYTASEVYTGGADTTVSTLTSFFLAMTRYPEVQTKAREEIDAVIGKDRVPTINDRQHLPYINALIKEILRYFPPVPTTLRQPTRDDHYQGTKVKEGTYILLNIWGMLRDEVYGDAMNFRPDRWEEEEAKNYPDPEAAFGFGRRGCPGRFLAQKVLFLVIASTLSQFVIEKVTDATGNEIVPEEDTTAGGIISPMPFHCRIVPRS
ncbi:cytochrome P450 [Cyathus striatus]|nr:cytochrome P450 [Cyathus striatus]